MARTDLSRSGIHLIKLNEKGEPYLTAEGMTVKELIALRDADHTKGHVKFKLFLKWLFFVYCEESNIYRHYKLSERKKAVFRDKIQEGSIEKLETNPLVKEAAQKIIDIQTLPDERFRNSARKKMEEYMDFWDITPITHENYKEIGGMLKGSNGLIEQYNTLKAIATKERKEVERQKGGGVSALFEDPQN